MTYKGIAFDIDGTLYPEWNLRSLGMVGPMARHPKLFSAYRKTREILREYNYAQPLRDEQARLIGEILNLPQEVAASKVERHLYKPWDKAYRKIKPFPGVNEALSWIQSQGIPMAALSDFPVSHKLETLGVGEFFPVRLSSEDAGYLKPHKAPFLALAEAMQLDPTEILYVGNSYRKDVEGASAVGMGTVLIGTLPKNATVTPLFTVAGYPQFLQKISEFL